MEEQKKLLQEIFEITEGKEESKAFTDMFVRLLFEDIVFNLIQSLSPVRRASVGTKWDANAGNHAALASLLKHNFTNLEIEKESAKTTQKAIQDYLQSVADYLNEDQKQRLEALSESIT